MRQFTFISLVFLFLLAACAAAPSATELPPIPGLVTITPEGLPFHQTQAGPQALESLPVVTQTSLPVSPTPALTSTPAPTLTPAVTPTETLLPLLELPTEKAFAPALLPWTGLPTYPGDSEPGLLFRVEYDPDVWAQTEDNYGNIVLAHRKIDYCTISPWSGRGLPGDWKVEHEFRSIGGVDFDVSTVLFQNNVQFVTYAGGDKRILTAFQVSFQEQSEQCLADAEKIFATLRSLAALPTATPTIVVESPTPTP